MTTPSLAGSPTIQCGDWTQIGADALVEGEFQIASQLSLEVRVWDVARCMRLAPKIYREPASVDRKRLAHRVADDIIAAFTGIRGVSSTEITFVSTRDGRTEIYVMDAMGTNQRRATRNASINNFPSWTPGGDGIVYTSYRHQNRPLVFLSSRGSRPAGRLFSRLSSTRSQYRAVFSPSGTRVASVMSEPGQSSDNHKRCGKVIVACDETELDDLKKYHEQATVNGVEGLEWLDRDRLAELEPAVKCVRGFLSPKTGVIDSHGHMHAYHGDAEEAGAMLALRSPVKSGRVTADGIVLEVGGDEAMTISCRSLINSAGLWAPDLARGIEGVPAATIPPTYYAIGHYFSLAGPSPFKRLVYPVSRRDWLGVHVTVDLGGQCKFGPDFHWIDRIDYTFDTSLKDAFAHAIRRYYPGLQDEALQPGYTGIRPKIHGPNDPVPDFLIHGPQVHGVPGLVNLFGIESPGLTSSLAIGDYVSGLLAA